jgi:hypothetical protein
MIDTLHPDNTPIAEVDGAVTWHELRLIERSLASVSARLDWVGAAGTIGDGVAVMALDQASQAVHLALLEVQACLEVA